MRLGRKAFLIPISFFLFILIIPAFASPAKPGITLQELSELLMTASEDSRDQNNSPVSNSRLSGLFAFSMQKAAVRNFKATKYALEEPKTDPRKYFRDFNERTAGTAFPAEVLIVALLNTIKNIRLLVLLLIPGLILCSGFKLLSETSKNTFQFHSLIPLRI